ncbi:hypothetical protein CES86_4328 [Brucella lupini]|jgi:hypothetical protein|uniref:Uncharacterized protein n=1 Tax=Brucella lupini TaxID=255457 RepID=A0A256GFD5_9HYPH|nr:hypothetical protein CES86_4328 [Brucella lupini]
MFFRISKRAATPPATSTGFLACQPIAAISRPDGAELEINQV